MNRDKTIKERFNRRDFLITLGAGTSLAIAGFFTFDAITTERQEQAENHSEMPMLSKQVQKTHEHEQLALNHETAKCLVNKTGEKVVELLNGRRSLPQIADKIADYYAIEHTDALEVSIASFICQLGAQGFLASPFFVTMYEDA